MNNEQDRSGYSEVKTDGIFMDAFTIPSGVHGMPKVLPYSAVNLASSFYSPYLFTVGPIDTRSSKPCANANPKVKNMIKSTNLSFGNEPTVYRSMATDQMNLQVPEGEHRGAQLEKNRLLKVITTAP